MAVGLVAAAIPIPALLVFQFANAVDAGAGCAQCAALGWVDYMGSLWWDNDGETRTSKDTAPDQRRPLLAQRAAYIRQIRNDIPRFPMVAGTDFEQVGADALKVVGQGDTATVTINVAARWPNEDDHGLWFYSEPGTWRFDVRRDSTGWRIWSVDMPPWCGTYSRCTTPPLTPAAGPSPTPEDLLAPLRSMLPCQPYDPYRQWHSCPPTS